MNEKEYELYMKVSKMTDEEFREAVKKAGACDILEKTSDRQEKT